MPTMSSSATNDFLIISSVSGVSLLSTFLSGALTISLPSIAASLNIPEDSLHWPISMYSLVNGTFLLVGGSLADIIGRKTLFIIGTALFIIFSIVVSTARTSLQFTVYMAVLGLAPAVLSPAGAGILGATFPPGRTKNMAFAALGAGQPLGFIIGLVSGGLLSTQWRIMYWMLAAIAFAFGAAAIYALPPDNHIPRSLLFSKLRAFDWVGSALSTISATTLIFALSDAEAAPDGWSTPYIPALLPTSATFGIGFLWWEEKRERDGKHTLLPLSIWRAKGLGFMMLVVFLTWMSFNTLSYLSTLMYQQVQGLTPMRTAVLYLPMIASGFFLNVFAGYLTGKLAVVTLVSVGLLLSVGSCIAFSLLNPSANYGIGMFWVMLLLPGPDLFFSAASIYVQNSVGEDKQALAGSLFNVAIRFATSFGLAICSAVSTATSRKYASQLKSTMHSQIEIDALSSSPRVLLEGYRAAGWTCLTMSCTALLIATWSLRHTGIVGLKRGDDDINGMELNSIIDQSIPAGGEEKSAGTSLRSRDGPFVN